MLAGTLPLRYCFDRFACRTPTWRLPVSGRVVDLVTANVADGHRVVPATGKREVLGVRNSSLRRKRFDSAEKKPSTPCTFWCSFNLGHVCGQDCNLWIFFGDSFPGHKRRRCDQDHEGFIPAQARTGVGLPSELVVSLGIWTVLLRALCILQFFVRWSGVA